MTDQSVPVGDRDEFPRPTGPAMARAALDSMSAPEFRSAAIAVALRHGWQVHRLSEPLHNADTGTYLIVRDTGGLVMYPGTAGPSFATQQWMARLCRVEGVEQVTFLARDGLAAVEHRLRRRPADAATVHADWVRPPFGATDGGQRGD